ncbi:hypothetical protein ENSA7_54390 [Enhygromyxa salina]|uniref:Baseplate protein J-like barrel domain-containing protein n=1 Tax=Enhygromyxa salina TaxID=215803 RepID=A0A2S9YDH2_9BACT|nr:hypothetical protein ENSA7_54390 [Enhygromyxa salina]
MIGKLENKGDYHTGPSINELGDSTSTKKSWPILAMASTAGLEKLSGLSSYFYQGQAKDETKTYLDGVYSHIVRGDVILVEQGNILMPSVVTMATVEKRDISDNSSPPINVPITTLIFSPAAKIGYGSDKAKIRIWFNARKAGVLERIPTATVKLTDILNKPRPITATTPNRLPLTNADIIIEDAEGTALSAKGHLYNSGSTTKVNITAITTDGFSGELVKPITFHWGLTKVTRGQTVARELLGDGDATQSWQSFTLAKSPLTYVTDPYAPNGRRAELAVWVNGIKWRQAQSFYGATATDEIYVVKHDKDHNTQIIFGDGELGLRLPTGPGNVIATYRFGVGGNVDAKTINRLVKPIKGVKSVTNPLPATGGEDPPTPEQAREQAIQSTRVLGRLVSLPDFEVEAARFGGVLQAKAEWAWDPVREDAVAKVWIVAPGPGDPSPDLQAYLEARCEPGTLVRVEKAASWGGPLFVDLEFDPDYLPDQVEAAVDERLYDSDKGLLAPRNAPIARSLFRSQLYAAIHEIEGVLAVRGLSYGGEQMPAAVPVPEGHYLAITKSGPYTITTLSPT